MYEKYIRNAPRKHTNDRNSAVLFLESGRKHWLPLDRAEVRDLLDGL